MGPDTSSQATECFVVMPFGKKPLPDGRTYDFDKVYRVIIQRAVQEAGMKPLRADETVGSRLIHSDMFKDLRDRAVVLADLSLENPNVFYELGIRHVMAPSGTVLICRKGTELPFDVRLSRVVFYKFHGDDLDWEEVEETIKTLKLALQDAQKKQPDSPVHVLLETVVRTEKDTDSAQVNPLHPSTTEDLEKYEASVAEHWRQQGTTLEQLVKEHCDTVFGLRALAHFCLSAPEIPDAARDVARRLQDAEQYATANRIYERLHTAGRLMTQDLLGFASSYSEEHPDLRGAAVAINYIQEVLAAEQKKANGTDDDAGLASTVVLADAYRRLGGLLQWKGHHWQSDPDLASSIEAHTAALGHMTKARAHGKYPYPGLVAQTHLKLLLSLRMRDKDAQRPDPEGHRDAILKMQEMPNDRLVGISYFRWYQAIALADLGRRDEVNAKVLDQLTRDAILMTKPDCHEVGRREYFLLRRFLENFSKYFRHPELTALISRQLYMGLRKH